VNPGYLIAFGETQNITRDKRCQSVRKEVIASKGSIGMRVRVGGFLGRRSFILVTVKMHCRDQDPENKLFGDLA